MRSWRRSAVLPILLCGPWIASAAPINTNTAFAPHEGETIIRLQYRYTEAGDDPSNKDRDLETQGLVLVGVHGFTERLAGIVAAPYLDKELELDIPSEGGRATGPGDSSADRDRIARETSGLGDIRTLLKYRVYTKDTPGKTHRLGLFGGVEWPTGDDDDEDRLGRLPQPLQVGSGSYNPIIGAVWTTQTLGWQVDADLSYKFNTEANEFEFGDVASYNVSYQHRLWPRELPEEGVPSFLYGVLEINGSYAGKNEIDGAQDDDSGGHRVFLTPGLQWVSRKWVVEAGVQIPIVQEPNGDVLEVDYAATVGVRYRF